MTLQHSPRTSTSVGKSLSSHPCSAHLSQNTSLSTFNLIPVQSGFELPDLCFRILSKEEIGPNPFCTKVPGNILGVSESGLLPPLGSDDKASAHNDGRPRFNPWVGKIPWRRQWHPTPVLFPGNPMDGGAWCAAVHGVARSRTRLSDFTFTFHFHTLEKEMATPSSVLAWRIPGTEDPGRLQSMGSKRVGHN